MFDSYFDFLQECLVLSMFDVEPNYLPNSKDLFQPSLDPSS